jgi:hypothetical protein
MAGCTNFGRQAPALQLPSAIFAPPRMQGVGTNGVRILGRVDVLGILVSPKVLEAETQLESVLVRAQKALASSI